MIKRFTPLYMSLLLLSACADTKLDGVIGERANAIQGQLETARQPAAPTQAAGESLTVSDAPWAGDVAVKMSTGEPLPDEWLKPNAIAVRSDSPILLNQLAAVISSQTKIPIRLTGGAERVDADLRTAMSGGNENQNNNVGNNSNQQQVQPGIILAYEGPLPGLLDLVAGYYNVNWSYSNGTIVINRFVTKTFTLDALPGAINVAAPGATGASGGAAAAATATPLASANIDIWTDIDNTLTSILDGQGDVTISQSSGTIVVSTTTDRMERVSRYIADENARLSRQVAVTIELYTVGLDDSSQYGLDLTAALKQINGMPTINLSGPTSGLTDAASMTVTLVEPATLAGTQGIVKALSTLGKTTRVAQIPITTLNNRPANQRIALDTAYIKEVTTTVTEGSNTNQTSATTDTVTTGISISILPRIMNDGRVLLQYALAQGELLRLRNFDVGDNTVQLPETQGLSFSQQVMMKNGSTLVLAGFDQSDADSNARGLGSPLTWLFGGSKSATRSRQMVVIAITPREINVLRPEAL